MAQNSRPWHFALFGLLLFTSFSIAYLFQRHWHPPLFVNWALACAAYAGLLFWAWKKALPIRTLLIYGIVLRLLLIPAAPRLSEDVYRYCWDGHLVLEGRSPYATVPQEDPSGEKPHMALLLQAMNSPQYHSVYPPTSQYLFAAGAGLSRLFGGSLAAVHWAFGLLMFLAELGTLLLLFDLLRTTKAGAFAFALYSLNPLVLVELSGNLHQEAFAIFFITLSLWFWFRAKNALASTGLAGAFLAKFTPIFLAPFLFTRRPLGEAFKAAAVFLVTVALLSAPFFLLGFQGIENGLNLYFKSFEFNASVYYLVRESGFLLVGYNIIHSLGPLLSFLALGAMLLLWLSFVRRRKLSAIQAATIAWSIYFLFATTVHPWYIVPLLLLAVFSGWLWPYVWSAVIFFSYLAYGSGGVSEPMWLPVAEYALVAIAIYADWRWKPFGSLIEPKSPQPSNFDSEETESLG